MTKRKYLREWHRKHPKKNEEYYQNYKRKYGLLYFNKRNREKYHKRREELILRRRKKYRKNHIWIRGRYNLGYEILRKKKLRIVCDGKIPKCVCCGFSDWRALQIDHIKAEGRKKKLERYGGYTLKYLFKNRKNLQVLCSNCNWIKKYENQEISNKSLLKIYKTSNIIRSRFIPKGDNKYPYLTEEKRRENNCKLANDLGMKYESVYQRFKMITGS